MYDVLTGKQRSLVFPVMCNGFVTVDYDANVATTDYGIWDHDGSFCFEAVITPYDVNGYGKWSGNTVRSISNSKKIMPGLPVLHTDSSASDYQSNLYLKTKDTSGSADRLNHRMSLFHSTSLKIQLMNVTEHNENNPANYKVLVTMTIGGATQSFSTDYVISPDSGFQYQYASTDREGFDVSGQFVYDEVSSVTSGYSGSGTSISCNPTTAFIENVGQDVYARSGRDFVKVGTITTKTSSAITLTSAYSPGLSIGDGLFLPSYVEPSYVNSFQHIAVSYYSNDNAIEVYVNGNKVLDTKHSNSGTFAFDKESYYIGANGVGATGDNTASSNNQFMGEIHELAFSNRAKDSFQSHSNIVSNLNNLLMYLRFEETDA